MSAIEAKGARCHVSPPLPRNETSLSDRFVIVQVISHSCVAATLADVETLHQVQNTGRRYNDWPFNSFYFNNEESFFLDAVVRRVDNFALEDVTTVQLHQYLLRIGDIDVKNSEAHPLILQLHIARSRSRDIGGVCDINWRASLMPSLKPFCAGQNGANSKSWE